MHGFSGTLERVALALLAYVTSVNVASKLARARPKRGVTSESDPKESEAILAYLEIRDSTKTLFKSKSTAKRNQFRFLTVD